MTAALAILRAGPSCTLQDAGRAGLMRYGVTAAGPMDWRAHRLANLMAGNPGGVGAIEAGPGGIDLGADGGPLRLGLCASGFTVRLDGKPLASCAALILHPGSRLTITPTGRAVWSYVAVAGGVGLPPVMGSLSMHLRSGIGPLEGQALRAGQALPATAAIDEAPLSLHLPSDDAVIRLVPGPQDDHFLPGAMVALCGGDYRVGHRSDRMGYRLEGARLAHRGGHDIVSDGIPPGAIQVPGDGQPIVLMADRQPTGGYPKIGTVIRADLPKLAQTPPGGLVRFRAVTRDQAVQALADALALCDIAMAIARGGMATGEVRLRRSRRAP